MRWAPWDTEGTAMEAMSVRDGVGLSDEVGLHQCGGERRVIVEDMVDPGVARARVESLEWSTVQMVQERPGRVGPTVCGGPVLQSGVGAARVGGLPGGVEIAEEEGEVGRVALVLVGVLHDEMLEVFQGGWGIFRVRGKTEDVAEGFGVERVGVLAVGVWDGPVGTKETDSRVGALEGDPRNQPKLGGVGVPVVCFMAPAVTDDDELSPELSGRAFKGAAYGGVEAECARGEEAD